MDGMPVGVVAARSQKTNYDINPQITFDGGNLPHVKYSGFDWLEEWVYNGDDNSRGSDNEFCLNQ
jgi:hypothetical protein